MGSKKQSCRHSAPPLLWSRTVPHSASYPTIIWDHAPHAGDVGSKKVTLWAGCTAPGGPVTFTLEAGNTKRTVEADKVNKISQNTELLDP